MRGIKKKDLSSKDFSISPEKKSEIIEVAYIPEHIISLMQAISGGEPGIIDDFLFFVKDNWIMFIGYPLSGHFQKPKQITENTEVLIDIYDPEYIWVIAPEIPSELKKKAVEFQKDYYYTLLVEDFRPNRRLLREVEKASESLKIRKERVFSSKHSALRDEFIRTKTLHPMVISLYNSMEDYFRGSETAILLSAATKEDEITAFYCLDCGAHNFLAYITGCHSKTHYVPHASDLLFVEMVGLARQMGKTEINLGLGVTDGLRRFKEKWGGRPTIPYEFIEWRREPDIKKSLKALQSIL
ncbi:MAG TPA: hypothetical protein PLR38_07565 [Syntrophorhabdaceae bacterium]|nr:hypothetical protein [Syntrophorhabdaceae bacterium]HOL05237.1 hypothetical protein [Syntrophorhabdaceae bacterium]HRV22036.1 hypothetical protein [Syntrophorhabdaceae bacterium]